MNSKKLRKETYEDFYIPDPLSNILSLFAFCNFNSYFLTNGNAD